jgi:hypothetical protein
MGAAAMGFAYFQQKTHDEEINELKATLSLVKRKQHEQDEIGSINSPEKNLYQILLSST